MVAESFEDLCQSLRIFVESHFKFQELIQIDRAEAVGNMENAFKDVLNSFHSLYDALRNENAASIDWYGNPSLALILAMRNAKHHNAANKIRNIFNYHVHCAKKPSHQLKYLLVDFPSPPIEVGGDCFEFFVSWSDVSSFLELPKKESYLRKGKNVLIRDYLNAANIEHAATAECIPKERIFLNSVPLILNAGITLAPHIKTLVATNSTESKHFKWHFENVGAALTHDHEISTALVGLPE